MKNAEGPRGHAQVASVVDEEGGTGPQAGERAHADGRGEKQEGEYGSGLDEEYVEVDAPEEGAATDEPRGHDRGEDRVELPLRGEGHGCMKTMKVTTVATTSTHAIHRCRCSRLSFPVIRSEYATTALQWRGR